ncbi:alpha/beta hydrolase [Herbaspirillum sp. HC18]|nr:alpha/beta hydrolase [Herbaspirillum sp. HC18]
MNYVTSSDIGDYARQAAVRVRENPRRNAAFLAVAAALAASALYVRQRTREAERDNPPAGNFVEVDGIRLHYVERGTGQPIVLLHGDGAMLQDFDISGVLDLAAQKYRVIAFDRPGYGYSDRPRTTIWTPQAQASLLHRALQQIGVSQPIVVGHSWGTLVAIAMGLDYADDVKSLVLLSGYYYPTARLDVSLFSPPAIPIIGDLLNYTVAPLIGKMIWPAMKRRVFAPAEVPRKFEDRFPVWMMLRPSQLHATEAESVLMIPAAYSLRNRYHELTMPVVIMAGEKDRYVDRHAHSEQLHDELPHSTYHVSRGAGHMVHHLAPDEVMEAIDHAAVAVGAEQRGEHMHIFPTPEKAV